MPARTKKAIKKKKTNRLQRKQELRDLAVLLRPRIKALVDEKVKAAVAKTKASLKEV